MENPATWGEAEHVVNNALREHDSLPVGFCGLSRARRITDALREAGLLMELKQESLQD